MSQYNETYGLKGVSLFGNTPTVVTTTTDIELNQDQPSDTTFDGDKYFKCKVNIPIESKEIILSNTVDIPLFNKESNYKSKTEVPLFGSEDYYDSISNIPIFSNENKYNNTLEVPVYDNNLLYSGGVDIPVFDKEILFNNSFMIPEILLSNQLLYNNKFKVPEYYRETMFESNLNIPKYDKSSLYKSNINIREYYREVLYNGKVNIPKLQGEAFYNNALNIPQFIDMIDFKNKLNIPKYDTSLFYKNNINIIEGEEDDGKRLKLFKNNITFKVDKESFYKSTFSISPTNRMKMIADIFGYGDREYKNTVNVMVQRLPLYKSTIMLKPNNSLSLKFSVVGGADKLFKTKVTFWDDNLLFFKCKVVVPTVEERPIHLFKNTVKITQPNIENMYKSTIRIEPNTKVKLTYDLLSGMDNLFKTNVTVAKEHTHLFKCSFVINPTNRMTMVADILGFNERLFGSTVKLQAQAHKLYPAKVTIGLAGHLYTRIKVDDTPKHLYYGNLKKDAHVLEDIPNANYGGDTSLYFNNKSIVYLEWNFEENKDQFYKPNLEFGSGLRLYLKKAIPENAKGRVFLVTEEWDEYGIKYNNRPKNLELVTEFEVKRNTVGRMDIDLGDLLYQVNKKDIFRISLAVEIDTPINTLSNSRETGIDIPALYYKYYYIPPNNRQLLFAMNMKILKAYGKGNGKGFKFPALGEENHWSHPAMLYPSTVYHQPEQVLPVYKSLIHIPTVNVEKLYKSTVNIYNLKPGNALFKSTIKIPLFEGNKEYKNTMFMPDMEYKLYKSTFEIERRDRQVLYPTSINLIRGYGKGFDDKNKYPHLGQEGKWSGEAPHWKNTFFIPKLTKEVLYPAKVTIQKAVGKGNGRYTQYPALGEQKPWSKPAIIFPNTVRIALNEETFYYKNTFFNDRRFEFFYPNKVVIPKFDKQLLYKSTVHIPETLNKMYPTVIKIPIFDNMVYYKSTFKGIGVNNVLYKSTVTIEQEGVKVRIFIM